MKKKTLFNLFLKKLSNGTEMYYYTTYDEEGKRKQFSTGEKDKNTAYQVCYDRLQKGKILVKSKMIFKEFTKDWFKHDVCPYYSIREAKGRTYSKSNMDSKRLSMNKHLLPVFSDLRLDHISTILIENWLQDKKNEGYAINTVNSFLSLLRLVLGEAKRTGVIDRNPCDNIIKYTDKKREKGILTDDEVKKLFNTDNKDKTWKNHMHYLINYTAIVTGCRVAEIICLTHDKIHEGYIEISNSYDRKYGIKSTKSGETRYVPISGDLHKQLIECSDSHKGRFIFSGKNLFKPVNYATVNNNFKAALVNIGISEDERKSRDITFHSYRHKANTKLRESGISDAVIRKIIGHKSSMMTENYSHIDTRNINYTDLKVIV